MKNVKKAPLEAAEKHKRTSEYQAAKSANPKMETEKHSTEKKTKK